MYSQYPVNVQPIYCQIYCQCTANVLAALSAPEGRSYTLPLQRLLRKAHIALPGAMAAGIALRNKTGLRSDIYS